MQQECSLTHVTALDVTVPEAGQAIFCVMEVEAIRDVAAETSSRECRRAAGVRNRGQCYQVKMAVSSVREREGVHLLSSPRFHEAHERRYKHKLSSEVADPNGNATGICTMPESKLNPIPDGAQNSPKPLDFHRRYFGPEAKFATPMYRRVDLAPGIPLAGADIVQEQTSGMNVSSGKTGKADGFLNIQIDAAQVS